MQNRPETGRHMLAQRRKPWEEVRKKWGAPHRGGINL